MDPETSLAWLLGECGEASQKWVGGGPKPLGLLAGSPRKKVGPGALLGLGRRREFWESRDGSSWSLLLPKPSDSLEGTPGSDRYRNWHIYFWKGGKDMSWWTGSWPRDLSKTALGFCWATRFMRIAFH